MSVDVILDTILSLFKGKFCSMDTSTLILNDKKVYFGILSIFFVISSKNPLFFFTGGIPLN